MSKLEKGIIYLFSFIFCPVGLIVWIVSMFNQNQQFKSVGRVALYVAATSFCLQLIIGVLNFVWYSNIKIY
ncbi:hypothetical protein [Brevibacillus agri]|uniref:hypothetical protein n=1 Tax=Brevibacillus agri TaxID=51101 RepID=UPI0002715DDA|nr:hypothetical protein [Brevibacillus agri]EJL40649.1 hypothetical protein PMI08_04289 [Brevibacillus sp. CF112]ELK39514.1 hypothetical protein D478_24033 [Brevibacillus agri BAB-2500]MBG9567780.1 hypothetical protein [Brevibacillus agri]WHX29918.1 hypothetical protein QNK09_23130 [Brevibacillus agri]